MLHETDLSRADLNLLVLFEVVLEEGHVGRAAERLHLSPSAVSHGLNRLRQLLNDPLFLKAPKGVVPSDRAVELAPQVADILGRVRRVVATAEPFDPATSRRRFMIGAPDGSAAVIVFPFLETLGRLAPGVDISIRQLLPPAGSTSLHRAWEPAFADLDSRAIDVAVIPVDEVPARFAQRILHEEVFVIAARGGHPFLDAPTLDHFCEMRHLVVSLAGDPHGFVDIALAAQGRSRRIALTVPNFMFALAVVAETDLLAALPARLVAMHARRFGVSSADPPLALPSYRIRAIAPRVALMDAAVAWLLDRLGESSAG